MYVGAMGTSEIGDSEVFDKGTDFGEVDGKTESRDVGASRRKLHSKPFFSHFSQDGCVASHCLVVRY
jgi:hypothetical protein